MIMIHDALSFSLFGFSVVHELPRFYVDMYQTSDIVYANRT